MAVVARGHDLRERGFGLAITLSRWPRFELSVPESPVVSQRFPAQARRAGQAPDWYYNC